MNDPENAEESLARRLEALERRVAALEQRTSDSPSYSHSFSTPAPAANAPEYPTHGSSLLSLVGKAMLVVAGAYLLRAASTSSVIPQMPIVILSIVYAFAWLIPAARTRAKNQIPSLIWASTSAVIFLPMIWELTLRFRILSGASAASVLGLYVVVAAALGWNRHFEEVGWITVAFTSMASFALAVATHDLVPFIAALLVIAAVGELAVARMRKLHMRPLVAMIADGAIFALIWIYSSPAASRSLYPAISPVLLLILAPLLLSLYAASASSQIILMRRGISVFEITQTLIAFVLTCWGFFAFWSNTAELVLGALCLVASAAGYVVSFAWFRRIGAQRNYHVYATGSLALFLMGCFLSLPPMGLAISIGVFAVGVTFAAPRIRAISMGFQGITALVVTAAASGQILWSARDFAGSLPGKPGIAIILIAVFAVLCSIAVLRTSFESRWNPVLALTGCSLGVFASAGFLVWALAWIGIQLGLVPSAPAPQNVAVIRTFVACAFAIGLAWSGSVLQRRELAWLAWPVLALTAIKLLFEDVRIGHLAFTAASIFFYAVTLLLVSRLIRPGAATQSEGRTEKVEGDSEPDRK